MDLEALKFRYELLKLEQEMVQTGEMLEAYGRSIWKPAPEHRARVCLLPACRRHRACQSDEIRRFCRRTEPRSVAGTPPARRPPKAAHPAPTPQHPAAAPAAPALSNSMPTSVRQHPAGDDDRSRDRIEAKADDRVPPGAAAAGEDLFAQGGDGDERAGPEGSPPPLPLPRLRDLS